MHGIIFLEIAVFLDFLHVVSRARTAAYGLLFQCEIDNLLPWRHDVDFGIGIKIVVECRFV